MKKEKVLIVEDEIDLLDLVDFNLTRRGFLTAGALDGIEAMEKVDSFDPDLVILDLMLPKLDGWEVCKALKQRGKDIPVIMLTAKCMPEDKVRGFESGADDYMTKPFNIKELIIRINHLLEKKRNKNLQTMLIHEVTNRVSTIGCYSDLLEKKAESLDKEKRSLYLKNISQQVAYTTELISEIRSMADIESKEFSLKTEKCDLSKIVSDIVESHKSTAAHKGVDITLTYDEALPEVGSNAFALKQVFTNLVGNAIKYSKENGSVEVSVKSLLNGVAVSVRDNGLGIPKGEIPKIFEKGYRASNAPKNIAGSGYGLYISKILLDKMSAAVTFGSVEGKGSVFTVFLKGDSVSGYVEKPAC
ncbi:MAG: response regulator [Deltaproteobacteria bacterium]|nr:response regulator [Deltaproteobacteria bacterium]